MKKNLSILKRGISMALAVMLLFTMTAFADTATQTADTETYTYIKDSAIYKTNGTHNYQFAWSGREFADFYTYAQGGLLLELPIKDMNIPATVKSDNISKAELKMTIRYGNAANITEGDSNAMNDATRILFLNVTKDEHTAIQNAITAGGTGTLYDGTTVASHAPQSVKNYIEDALAGSYPRDAYTDGYLNKSVKWTHGTALAGDETGLHYEITYDVTDLIKDGSLSEARYLLLQRGLYKGTSKFNAAKSYYVPATNYPPVLTVTYTVPNDATKVESHKSKNDEAGAKVTFANDYAYTVTFDGDVNVADLNEGNIILTDSEGTVIDLDGPVDAEEEVNCITWDAATKTVTIPLPACDTTTKNNAEVKWLKSGETYTLTLKKDIKNVSNAAFLAEDWTTTFTMEDKAYDILKTSIRAGATQADAKNTKNQKTALNEGEVGTNKDEWLYTYSYFYNYTSDTPELLCMLAVYNEKGMLVQCGVHTPSALDNQLALGYPGLQLTQDLKEGYSIKSFIWNLGTMQNLHNTSKDVNGAIEKMVIGAKAE